MRDINYFFSFLTTLKFYDPVAELDI